MGGAQLALGLPELGCVPHDRDDLVVVDRHHPGLELAFVAPDRRQHVADRLQLPRVERLSYRRHERLCDLRRKQVVHPAADDILPGVGEELGVADEVDIDAVGRDAEHQVGDCIEQRAHARLDIRPSGRQVLLFHRRRVAPGSFVRKTPARASSQLAPSSTAMSTSARTSSSCGTEVDEAGPEADLAVDGRGRHPNAGVVLQRAHEQRVCCIQIGRGAEVPERDDRERRRAAERLELIVLEYELVEQPRLPQVLLDR